MYPESMSFFLEIVEQPSVSVAIAFGLLLIHVAAVLSAYHALQYVRTSQAAVAWVVGLLTLPYFTVPLYWVFARRRFAGYREALREVGEQHQQSAIAVWREMETGTGQRTTSLQTPLEQVADVLDTPISSGNQFRLLIDGHAFLDTVLSQIRTAEKYVYACFYIIRDDSVGNQFAEALIERARAGIKVRLLYDEVGSLNLSNSYLSRLIEAGVDVRSFDTRQGWANRFQINFRNHRKLVVVDGRRAVIGGLNIGDEYVGNADWVSQWRDTSVEMVGSIARKIQAVFARDYYWAARLNLPEADWSSELSTVTPPSDASGLAAACATGPADHRPRAAMMFAAVIGASKERLWISTPYLVPDDAVMIALAMAKARGVDVRILIPSVADQWAVYMAGFYYERELAEIGVPVYRFKEGMLHQKCVLVDESLALVGSTNLDNRSLYLNFELMVAIQDQEFITHVVAMLEKDFSKAQLSNGSEVSLRPRLARIGTAIARLFSPVL
jgi:cardiolipin synthase A/B